MIIGSANRNSMPFTGASFDAQDLALFTRVFDEAWAEILFADALTAPEDVMKSRIAARIMSAAQDGERDPARLKAVALGKAHP
jgi:hypothetical protein